MASIDRLSLYHEVSARGYEASIIGTYALSFQFYERVVLRRLQASGCKHNIVLADAGQCGQELASGEGKPHFCGADYALLPIRSTGAFHPKFILLLGRRRSRLIIGSHNLTVAGFGLNREVTTASDIEPAGATIQAAREVWQFVRAWTSQFPHRIQDVIGATERVAPWLGVKDHEQSPEQRVLCALPTGPSLWQQLRPVLSEPVRRIHILSPYFDSKLGFVQTLEKELNPKELVLAIHPTFSELSSDARSLVSRCRFVDVTQFGDEWVEQYLHAKIYRFEFAGGKSIVVSGSANASEPAWLGSRGTRNAEIIVVHQAADRTWEQLGLSRLTQLPEVSQAGWESIRLRTKDKTERKDRSVEAPYLATVTPEGFMVDIEFTNGVNAENIQVLAEEKQVASIEKLKPIGREALCICLDAPGRESATSIEVALPKCRRIALVLNVEDLLDKAAGSLRQAFRRALTGLEGNADELNELLHVVEKAIFDEPIHLETEPQHSPRAGTKERTGKTTAVEPQSLMIHAKDTVRARRRRRLSTSSDLALIIDALIYRLGLGLRQDTDSSTSVKLPEETLRDQSEETPEVDGHALAKLCRKKVNRLFKRMVAQLELAAARGSNATTPIIQLAAVLGVVKHLRVQAPRFDWLPKGEETVDADKEREFFKDVARLLYAPKYQLAAKALAEHGGQEFDELTIIRALLSWLAFDFGLDTRSALDRALTEPELVRENLIGVGYFLPVITECSSDSFATEILEDAAAERPGDVTRATYHVRWAKALARSVEKHLPRPSIIALGDIALPLKVKGVPPSVVVDAQNEKAGLLNLDSGELKYYASGFLTRIQALSH